MATVVSCGRDAWPSGARREKFRCAREPFVAEFMESATYGTVSSSPWSDYRVTVHRPDPSPAPAFPGLRYWIAAERIRIGAVPYMNQIAEFPTGPSTRRYGHAFIRWESRQSLRFTEPAWRDVPCGRDLSFPRSACMVFPA